jgi:hypothetical protein
MEQSFDYMYDIDVDKCPCYPAEVEQLKKGRATTSPLSAQADTVFE